MRGLGGSGRRKQLCEIMGNNKVDIICLKETIKSSFTSGELAELSMGGNFSWNWTASRGTLEVPTLESSKATWMP
jgi:hypothetical protein